MSIPALSALFQNDILKAEKHFIHESLGPLSLKASMWLANNYRIQTIFSSASPAKQMQ